MLIKEKPDDKKEAELDKLKDEYLEVQQSVSDLRKSGKDTSIADIMLLEIPAKIRLARSMYEQEDIESVKRTIEKIRKEITDIVNGSEFDHINELLKEAFDHVRKDEKRQAIEKYEEIMKLYRLLTSDLKKTVFSACIELRKRISNG